MKVGVIKVGVHVLGFSVSGPEGKNQIALACLSRLDGSLKSWITCTSPEPSVHIGHGPTLTVPNMATQIWPVLLRRADSSEAEGPKSLIYFLNFTF